MIGVVNRVSGPRDVVVCAAGSMPGDLHKLWRTRDPKGYHVEYGYSHHGLRDRRRPRHQAGRPRPRGLRAGRRRLLPDDGPGDRDRGRRGGQADDRPGPEPRLPVDRRAQRVASARSASAPKYRYRGTDDILPVDLAANAASLGADVRDTSPRSTTSRRRCARRPPRRVTTVVQIHTDPMIGAPDSEAWWDVPGRRGRRAGVDAGRARAVRAAQAHPEAVPEPGRKRPAVT